MRVLLKLESQKFSTRKSASLGAPNIYRKHASCFTFSELGRNAQHFVPIRRKSWSPLFYKYCAATRLVPTRSRGEPIRLLPTGPTTRLGNESFDGRDAARQSAGHPLDAFRRDHHVVFDAHADAFILFECGPYGSDEFLVIRSLR